MKRSRLNINRKKRRKILGFFVLFLLFIFGGGYLANHYGIVEKIAFLRNQVGHAESFTATHRGNIYDRNFVEIAMNLDKISVFSRNREVGNVEGTAEVLAKILSQDVQAIRLQLSSNSLRTWLAEGISKAEEKKIKQANLQGVYLGYQPIRFYPQRDVAAHLTGFVQDDVGLAGVEHYFDKLLGGALNDDIGNRSFKGVQDLVLTLDLQAQAVLQKLLLQISQDKSVERLAGYVMETDTGKIVAGAQYPLYDPNNYRDYPHSALGNMFLQPIPVPAKFRGLLEDTALLYDAGGKVDRPLPWSVMSLQHNLSGELLLWNWLGFDGDWQPDFASSEKEMWGDRHYFTVQPGERKFSSVPESATPLQILTGLASMTGSGKPIRGHVVERIVGRDGGEESNLGMRKKPQADLTQSATRAIHEVQQLVAAQGGRDSFGLYFIEAEQPLFVRVGDSTSLIENKMFFVSMPAEYEGLALLVSIERNSNVVENLAQETVSSMGDVLKRISALQQVSESHTRGLRPEVADRESFTVSSEEHVGHIETVQKETQQFLMPDLTGLSIRRSLQLLENLGCAIHVEGTGWVDAQYPPSGSVMKDVQTCRVTLQSPQRVRREVVEANLPRIN